MEIKDLQANKGNIDGIWLFITENFFRFASFENFKTSCLTRLFKCDTTINTMFICLTDNSHSQKRPKVILSEVQGPLNQ